MKKFAILLFITSSFVFAQNTYVPDDKFEQALIDLGYDTTMDDSVVTANISGVTSLDVEAKEISDLTGIEAFTALTYLNCSSNKLTSLDVSKNTALIKLNCYVNQLTSLDVSANTALIDLAISHNQLTSINVTSNTALTILESYANKLTSLDVTNNTALTELYVDGAELATGLDVSKNTALTKLYCGGSQLTSLDVSKNTELRYFQCYYNKITSLDVSNNTALIKLDCSANQLTSLDVSNNTALNELQCWKNQLTSLDVSKNTALTSLNCFRNQLTSLDVSKNTALTYLHCQSNQLTGLDVSKNTALTELRCDNNQLTSLDVSANTALTYLHCSDNQLTSLDVSKNKALTSLNCWSNQLASLNVSKNTALNELQCWKNQLTILDVSKNKALSYLSCEENQLTSLDVSSNTTLTYLECGGNQLTSLNMRNGVTDSLSTFIATGNSSLTCIETLDPTYATANWTSANGKIDAGVTFSVICGGTDLTTWHVSATGSDGSGSGTEASPLATIQTGINAATESDTVLVAAGTYKENINLNQKDIHVIGANRETTIIDGDQKGTVVKFHRYHNHNKTVLSGFTITNGKGTVDEGGPWGGGIEINGAANPLLRDLIIENNTALNGAGINLYNSASPNIENCIIRNNQTIYPDPSGKWAAGRGGGISADDYDGTMKNVLFAENSSESGGALGISNWDTTRPVNIVNCTFVNNYSSGFEKGDIYLTGGNTLNITNSIIWDDIYINTLNGTVTLNIENSLIQGGYSGDGNIDVDPLFCDTTSYTLYATSPAVGTGENGVNMGAMGVGCDVPLAFTWVTPSEYDTVNITKENLNTEYIVKWTTSKDIYNDSLRYHIVGTGGNLIVSTSDTSNSPTYQELLEEWPAQFQMLSRMTYVYDVWATDGKDSTKITGEPRKLYVNRYDYLSTESEGIPTQFALHENYPNPFNPTTTLRFDLPEVSDITLTIYNMLGQKVRTFDYQNTSAGYHSVTWDATNDYGDPVGAGVYLYQLQTKDFVKTRKMVLLK